MPVLPLILIALMFAIGLWAYPQLGPQIPMHWNAAGEIDRWSPTTPASVFMLPLIALGLYALFVVMPYFEPKRRNLGRSVSVYRLVLDLVTGLLAVVYLVTLATSLGYDVPADRIIGFGVGLMFVVLGNYIGRVKQNWTMGFRYSWTLADEQVWVKTNRLGGRLFVACGLLGCAGAFMPQPWNWALLLVPLLVTIPVTYFYSMRLYHRLHPEESPMASDLRP
jgi:uncharacterized membrane protein